MKKIYIFGAGGLAKEVYFLIAEINKENLVYEVAGFLDINPSVSSILIGKNQIPVINELLFFKEGKIENACFAVGIGDPSILKKIHHTYFSRLDFPNLIHPKTVGFFETIEMGEGNIVSAGCSFTVDIKMGSFNIFNPCVTVGHDCTIGSCNVINPAANLSGGLEIGNEVLIGTNATILQYLKVEDKAIIGAGSLVKAHVKSNQTIIGNPGVDREQFGKFRNFIDNL
jgi:sugar O-acyltransferase (sialic acid O-acetyltransferase NeuD family)